MSETNNPIGINLAELTSDIVSAYVGGNAIDSAALPDLIASVHDSLLQITVSGSLHDAERPTPPVPIKKSITPDYLISLEDGQPYKSLKRHLNSRGLSPAQYREKWGLPSDYPMVAPNYAKQRSDLAKTMGLGRKRVEAAPEPVAPTRAGRQRKAA
jgi:predicted transcriptional regulator